MNIKSKIYLCAVHNSWEAEPTFNIFDFIPSDTYVVVTSKDIEIEIPSTFNMTAAQIQRLEDKKEKITENFHQTIAGINTQIQTLQCLEMS